MRVPHLQAISTVWVVTNPHPTTTTLENLRTVDDEELTPGRDVMVAGASEAAADTPAFEVVVEMGSGDAGVAVLIDGDDVVGQITATSLGEFLQFREETRSLKPRVAA